MPRYRCLVLDHDDTAVTSTATVHYPSFVEVLRALRPGKTMSLREFYLLQNDPGFLPMCTRLLGFTDAEMEIQLDMWRRYMQLHIPSFYPGVPHLIRRQKETGGLLCVVSHSYAQNVLRDYAAAGLPAPDRVLGWELGPDRQKPHPEPLRMLMAEFSLSPADILVVDDLKPGFDMARAAGCAYAAALWAYADVPEMRTFALSDAGALPMESPAALER